MKMNFLTLSRKAFMILPMLGMFSLTGCEELIDCIASATPELQNKQLIDGNKGAPYSETISSGVKNDPNDNSYDYFYNVDGTLPDGLSYSVSNRMFSIAGTPTQSGTFSFKIILRVDPPDSYDEDGGGFFEDDDRICFGDDTTERSYTITVI